MPAASWLSTFAKRQMPHDSSTSPQTATLAGGAGQAAVSDGRALKGKRGVRRIINALRYSCDGLRAAWLEEDAFRQESIIAAALLPLVFWVHFSLIERIALLSSLALVLIVEILNTAIESAIDRQSFEINPLSKRAKDLGSAAVLLALLTAGGVWISILVAHFS